MTVLRKRPNPPAYAIDAPLDALSYDWLLANAPELLRAVEVDVAQGVHPHAIRQRVIERTGRVELALRCEQAARHITAVEK